MKMKLAEMNSNLMNRGMKSMSMSKEVKAQKMGAKIPSKKNVIKGGVR